MKTLLDELEEIDHALTEGDATLQQERRGLEIVTLVDTAQDVLAVVLSLRRICGRQANILSTATEEERRAFIKDVYDLVNGAGNSAVAKATGAAS